MRVTSPFLRCVEELYTLYSDKSIDSKTLNDNLWLARQNFWSWSQSTKNSDRDWKDLVERVISFICPDFSPLYGVSNYNPATVGNSAPSASAHKSENQDEKVNKIDLKEAIEVILDRNLTEAERDLELVELAKKSDNYNAKEVREIASKRERQRVEEDHLSDRRRELENLENLESEQYLPFDEIFYAAPEIADVFKRLIKSNPKIQPQYFLSILSILGSLIGVKAKVKVPVLGKFSPTINTVCVGESGEGKSIVSGILMGPLYELQSEIHALYREQKKQYDEAVENWEKSHPDDRDRKPRPEEFITVSDAFLVINEYSREGIVKNHHDNPNGLLVHQEELIAICRAQNMYRQGKGDDRQFLNNLYDNKPVYRALKCERITVPETAVCITGGVQPSVILAEMGDLSDPDGQWARYNFMWGKEKQVYTDLDMQTVDLSPMLKQLYNLVYSMPHVECRIDNEGKKIFQQFLNEMEKLRWECLQQGKRAVYSKAAGEVMRIALILHCANCLVNNQPVGVIVPAIAIESAIAIKRYFLRQIEIVRTWGNASSEFEGGFAPMYRRIQKIAQRISNKKEFLTTRDVLSARDPLLKTAKLVEKCFKQIAAMNKGVVTKYKRGVALVISSLSPDNDPNGGINPNTPNTPNKPPLNGNNNPDGGTSPKTTPNKPTQDGDNNSVEGYVYTATSNASSNTKVTNNNSQSGFSTLFSIGENNVFKINNIASNSILLKTAEELLEKNQSVESSSSKDLKSFAESAESAGRTFIESSINTETGSAKPAMVESSPSKDLNSTLAIIAENKSSAIKAKNEMNGVEIISQTTGSIVVDKNCSTLILDSTQWKALLNFYSRSYLILVENESAALMRELDELEIEISSEDRQVLLNDDCAEIGCADATVIKTMLGFFGTGFKGFFAPIERQIEEIIDREKEQLRPTESELAEFEIDFEVGMKVINERSAERGTITAVCLREKTVTVEVDSGDQKRWYDNVVKPVPEQFFSYPKLINAIDLQIKRLGWSIDRASDYLFSQFKVRSRSKLNGEQLFSFLVNLQAI